MKPFLKFLGGVGLGFGLAVGLYLVAFRSVMGVPMDSNWCNDINQKKRVAADRITSPRLLIVGGSASLFGISARELEQVTGCPVINYSTHAVLGPTLMMYQT